MPSIEEIADDFEIKETNFYRNEQKSYACALLKKLIEELKSIPSSYFFCGACGSQAIDFRKTFKKMILSG